MSDGDRFNQTTRHCSWFDFGGSSLRRVDIASRMSTASSCMSAADDGLKVVKTLIKVAVDAPDACFEDDTSGF